MEAKSKGKYEDSSITVCVRARPLSSRELATSSRSALHFIENKVVHIFKDGVPDMVGSLSEDMLTKVPNSHRFCFDEVFDCRSTQEEVYVRVGRPVVASSFRGFNNCVFAYGQTGSGKSHSMLGAGPSDPGVIPRLCNDLFEEVEAQKKRREEQIAAALQDSTIAPPSLDVAIYVSYLEIYKENIQCLLSTDKPTQVFRVRENPAVGVYVENLKEIPVTSSEQILEVMNAGNEQRHISKTDMNDVSSRSHAVFSIQLIQKNFRTTSDGQEIVSEIGAKINLVDLAGSERAKQTNATGAVLQEGIQINKSLLTLGNVIDLLAKKSSCHIPYRESTLTFLLKESLGGNSKTLMLATLSPALFNYEQTLSTLRYAHRAKSIVIRAFVNENAGQKRIRELEEEVSRLQQHIKSLEGSKDVAQTVPTEPGENMSEMRSELCRAEELIRRFTKTTKDRELEAAEVLQAIQKQTTLHITRKDPYILNISGAGRWVIQYFVKDFTYFTQPSQLVEATEEVTTIENDDSTFIVIPNTVAGGIGEPHCCFHKLPTGEIWLSSSGPDCVSFVNGIPIGQEKRVLESGDMITFGNPLFQLRFVDLSTPPTADRLETVLTQQQAASPRDGSSRGAKNVVPGKVVRSLAPPPPLHLTDWEGGSRRPRSSSLSLSTGRVSSVPHKRATTPVGGSRIRSATPVRGFINKSMQVLVYQHNFVFFGPSSSGKTYCISNLLRQDKWYHFLVFNELQLESTWGISVKHHSPEYNQSLKLSFYELGGTSAFSVLADQLPTRQVTYVICFSLHILDSREELKSYLLSMFSKCHGGTVSLLLLGTYMDTFTQMCPREAIQSTFTKVESAIRDFFQEFLPDAVVAVAGKFAIDNIRRRITSMGFSSMTKFSELMQFLMDQAVNRCTTDRDYPGSSVPRRCQSLARVVVHTKSQNRFLRYNEYVHKAFEICREYNSNPEMLMKDTELLAQWGYLSLLQNKTAEENVIITDQRWASEVLTIMSLFQPFILTKDQQIRTSDLISGSNGLLVTSLDALTRFGSQCPFCLPDVFQADEFALLSHGAVTPRVLDRLFAALLNTSPYVSLSQMVLFLQMADLIIPGSKLLFPHTWELDRQLPPDVGSTESFYLIPFSFSHPPARVIEQWLDRFLRGPYFRLEYRTLPEKFFSQLVARLVSVTRAVYPGPSNPCEVDAQAVRGNFEMSEQRSVARVPSTPRFWDKCVWVAGPGASRVFLRQDGNTISVIFHAIVDFDSEFIDNILSVIAGKEKDGGAWSEWSLLVQGSETPNDGVYFPVDDKEDVIFLLRKLSLSVVNEGKEFQEEGPMESASETSDYSLFSRSWEEMSNLDLMASIIQNSTEETEITRFQECFEAWINSSPLPMSVEEQEWKGNLMDKLVDALARLQ